MKQKIFYLSLCLALPLGAYAQETYLNAAMSTENLNGTARYVGMGGAMEALGADISTIGTNPAGIGLFRSSQAKVSFGFVSQEGGRSFGGAEKTNLSFDQAGFVYSMRTSKRSFINFAFNYNKSSNFDYILTAASSLNGASQNKQSYMKGANGLFEVDLNQDGEVWGWHGSELSNLYNTADLLNYNGLLGSQDASGVMSYNYNDASAYDFARAHTGYVGEYDFNLSGNVNDRFYWGLTFGIHDVHYNAYSEYTENLIDLSGNSVGDVMVSDDRRITGTGYDFKAGVIIRPIEESPFRIGLSVASPIFYDLTSSNYTQLNNGSSVGAYDTYAYEISYDFRLNTPWKFGLSLGTTVGDYLALGASYEYSDYGSLDTRFKEDGYYDDWGYSYSSSTSDKVMKKWTEKTLKGVSTLKLGAEFKPDPSIAIRLGYNYVSPMYKDNAEKGIEVNSSNNAFTSTTDYTNWEATNRITAGIGYTIDNFTIDLAYQYSAQSGKFHPFNNYEYDGETNYADAVKVDNNRHQLLMTLGYKF